MEDRFEVELVVVELLGDQVVQQVVQVVVLHQVEVLVEYQFLLVLLLKQ